MTKRFSLAYETNDQQVIWWAVRDCDVTLWKEEVVHLLNEQWEEIEKYREWEKWVRDVRRETVDRVFKMSIYEIAEAFEYYEERIQELEKRLIK